MNFYKFRERSEQISISFKIFIFFVCIFGFLFFVFHLTVAQTLPSSRLYFLPESGSFEVGKTFSVRLAVDAGDNPINLVEANLSFSRNTLEVTGFSKTGTIINLWFNEPSFSNSEGTISFSGGIPNPGFTGIGRLLIINFNAKSAGKAWVKVSSAQVLANDGFGTNILSSSGQANFTLFETGLPKPTPVKPKTEEAISFLKIFSSTHPNQQKWYQNKDVILSWTWQAGINNYSFLLNQEPETIPDNTGEGLNTSVSYLDLKDKVWYFHLKAKTSAGWSVPSYFKIQIDTIPPENLKINFPDGKETYQANPIINFSAQDSFSGIAYYEIKIGENDFVKSKQNEFQLPAQTPGEHKITVRAYDQAGNFIEKTNVFIIKPLPRPSILRWTKRVLFAMYPDTLIIHGIAIPLAEIEMLLTHETGASTILKIQTNEKGFWTLIHKEMLLPGKYQAYAFTQYQEQVSPPSKEISFEVIKTGILIFGYVIPQGIVISCLVFLISLVGILIAILLFLKRKFQKCDVFVRRLLTRKGRGKKITVEGDSPPKATP